MSEAQVFDVQELLVGRPYHSTKRGDGWIVQADRKDNADKRNEAGDWLVAYAVRIRRSEMSFIHGTEDYWQTIFVNTTV